MEQHKKIMYLPNLPVLRNKLSLQEKLLVKKAKRYSATKPESVFANA